MSKKLAGAKGPSLTSLTGSQSANLAYANAAVNPRIAALSICKENLNIITIK